jgi:hypothetical protein
LPPFRSLLRHSRAAAVNIAAPIALGWLVATYTHTRIYPPTVTEAAPAKARYGPVHLKLRLAGTAPGIPEPVLTCGTPGNAAEVYIRVMPHAKASVGIDFWGLKKVESDPFPLPAQNALIEVTVYLPALFPPQRDPAWGSYSASLQEKWLGQAVIAVNGQLRLKAPVSYPMPQHSALYYGRNPLGGSVVSESFTGVIEGIAQSF